MKKLILFLLLPLIAAAGGIGAGLYLRPPPVANHEAETAEPPPETPRAYMKFTNQFVVPIVENDRVASLVVLSLSLEVGEGQQEAFLAVEPKLRDMLLRRLFDHASTGGFDGDFTGIVEMEKLHVALLTSAQETMPDMVSDVLITEIGRQDS